MASKIYNVPFTNNSLNPIKVPRRIFIDDIIDVTLIGKRTLEYGAQFNQNVLHLMEHFACESDSIHLDVPAIDTRLENVLNNPINGQLWYSLSTKLLHVWEGSKWIPFNLFGSVNGNSGFLFDGEYIPVPVDANGAEHLFSDCAINVSPIFMDEKIESFICNVDIFGKVTCRYTPLGGTERQGAVSYIILCHGNVRIMPTPSLTPTMTLTPSNTPPVTPTSTSGITPTITPTLTGTSAVTPTPTVTVTATMTGTPPVTPTYTPTNTVTPTGTPVGTPPVTPTNTPANTPPVTPTSTPEVTHTQTPVVTPTPTNTGTPASTPASTVTPTLTPTRTAASTPPVTATPTITPSSTAAVTPTFTPTRTGTPAVTPSSTAAVTPTRTPATTATQTPAVTPTMTPTPSNVMSFGFCGQSMSTHIMGSPSLGGSGYATATAQFLIGAGNYSFTGSTDDGGPFISGQNPIAATPINGAWTAGSVPFSDISVQFIVTTGPSYGGSVNSVTNTASTAQQITSGSRYVLIQGQHIATGNGEADADYIVQIVLRQISTNTILSNCNVYLTGIAQGLG